MARLNASTGRRIVGPAVIRSCIGLFLALSVTAPAAAQSEPFRPRLAYRVDGEARCPDQLAFVELVEARLGRTPFDDDAATTVDVRLSVLPDERSVEGVVQWLDAHGDVQGRRRLSASRCEDLAESLAVAVAILLEDPPVLDGTTDAPEPDDAEPSELPEEPSPAAPAQTAAAPDPSTEPATEPASEPASSVGVEIGGGVGASLGWTPGVAIAVDLGAGLDFGGWSTHLIAGVDLQPGSSRVGRDTVDAFHITVGLGLCIRPNPVRLCLEAGGGAFQATVQTVAEPEARTSGTIFVALRAGAALDLTESVALMPWLSVALLPLRPAISVENVVIWEASVVAGRAGLSVVGRIE